MRNFNLGQFLTVLFLCSALTLFITLVIGISGCGSNGYRFHTDTELESPHPNPSGQKLLIARR